MIHRMITVATAAARIGKSRSTIERWIRAGDLTPTRLTDEHGRILAKFVAEDELLAAWRKRLAARKNA